MSLGCKDFMVKKTLVNPAEGVLNILTVSEFEPCRFLYDSVHHCELATETKRLN